METLPTDLLGYFFSFSKCSLAYLVCKKWRDLYKLVHKKFRYFPESVLLNLNTTKWYVTTQADEETIYNEYEETKQEVFNYACRYSPIDVLDYLISKRYDEIPNGISRKGYLSTRWKLNNQRPFAPNCCLMSLDLEKIKWFFSLIIPKDNTILFELDISCVIAANNIAILTYLHSIGFIFGVGNLDVAAKYDYLETFKYLINNPKMKLYKEAVTSILVESAESPDIKIPRYMFEELNLRVAFDNDDLEWIFETAAEWHNLNLIKYLHSKGYMSNNLGNDAASYGDIEILRWMKENNVSMDTEEAITRIRESIRLKEKGIEEFEDVTNNKTVVMNIIAAFKEEIIAFNECIAYLDTL